MQTAKLGKQWARHDPLRQRHNTSSNELDGDEDVDYKHLTMELCQIYSHTSREFTIIDTKNPGQLYF
jgi:hypothetical protein